MQNGNGKLPRIDRRPKFPLGVVCVARMANQTLTQEDVLRGLGRHVTGDWGDVNEEDRLYNEDALLNDDRLFSIYHAAGGRKYYVITEWDRSVTTVLLPEEY